jgi:hypothetical protein
LGTTKNITQATEEHIYPKLLGKGKLCIYLSFQAAALSMAKLRGTGIVGTKSAPLWSRGTIPSQVAI